MESIDNNPQEYLRETFYCDFHHSEIQKIVKDFSEIYPDKKDLAIALFKFVRDEIKYKVGPWDKKASVTLLEKTGMCTSSANLLVALYRAAGIPAGYCIYKVRGGESFGHILPSLIKRGIHHDSVHIVCYVYLNNKWVKCDPSTDRDLSEKTRHISKLTELIDWDGIHDAVHPMDSQSILNVSSPLANIDYQLRKRPRYIVREHIFHIGNIYIDFLRTEGHLIGSKEEIEDRFKRWFIKNEAIKYYRYKIIYFLYKVYYKSPQKIKEIWEKIKKY